MKRATVFVLLSGIALAKEPERPFNYPPAPKSDQAERKSLLPIGTHHGQAVGARHRDRPGSRGQNRLDRIFQRRLDGKPTSKVIEDVADQLSFLVKHLRMKIPF